MLSDTESLTDAIVSFCQFTRNNGFNNGVEETITSLEAASRGMITDKSTIRNILRTILCSSQEEFEKFDSLFDRFWLDKNIASKNFPYGKIEYSNGNNSHRTITDHFSDQLTEVEEKEGEQVTGASPKEQLKQMDFSKIKDEHVKEMEKIAKNIWKNMSRRLNRKRSYTSKTNKKLDLRKTIRYNMSRGGELIVLKHRGRVKKKNNLVVLLDISGSMEKYCYFYLLFIYSLHKHFKNINSYTFSTRLHHVTKLMQKKEFLEIFEEIKNEDIAWLSGTKISDCLRSFRYQHSRNVISKHTDIVIISDGLDTGDPDLLHSELLEIKKQAKKIIWVNPLKGMDNYEPLTKGIMKILPLLDGFISGHNLETLEELEEYISNEN